VVKPEAKTQRPVLVLGTEPRVAVTVARSLWRRQIPVDVAFLSSDTWRLGSRAIRHIVQLPGRLDRPREFQEALEKLISVHQYDMIIPISDTALGLVANCYEALAGRVLVGCPAPAVVRRVLDKDSTLAIAQRCGIDIPKSYEIADAAALESFCSQLRFPVVAKDRSKSSLQSSTFKVRYFTTFEELGAVFRDDPQFGARALLQEYCPGAGVGLGMLIHRGQTLAAFQHRRLKELPSTGGVGVLAVAETPDPGLLRQAQELLRALEWEGVALVEFRQDRDTGRAVLMEVNGRFWGTCSFPVRCGIDFPFYQWQLAHGETPQIRPNYRVGVTWRWSSGYLLRLHGLFADPVTDNLPRRSRWRELVETLPDCGPWTLSALGSFRDPIPPLVELARTWKTLFLSDAKRLARRLLPGGLRSRIQEWGLRASISHLKRSLLRKLGLRRSHPAPVLLASARTVLFVCHGNIIRSALAEVLLKKQRGNQPDLKILSAGLHAKPGRAADERALQVAHEFGLSLDDHRATLLTSELVARADVIFVMDCNNEMGLLARFPQAGRKVFFLGNLDAAGRPVPSAQEIADPYEGNLDDVRRCGQRIRDCIDLVAAAMPPTP
jgi:protein-tyrosine-phosphatase/predicted ATP-grasp superfamily ATP-dependent carboligase